MLLALVVWIGGIIFFAFVLAPTLFAVLPSARLAGDVVSPALSNLHWMGLVSGTVFLIGSLLYNWRKYGQLRVFTTAHALIVLMLVLTAISQLVISPRMRELRSAPQGLDATSTRDEFDRLHGWSTGLESGVLLMGLSMVILTGRRFS